MDYKRKYFRRFGNQNQNQQTQVEEKVVIETVEEKPRQNVYMQRIIERSNDPPKTSHINLSSMNENMPSFNSRIRDIFSKDENKQKAINYVINKRNEDKYGRTPNNKDQQEESNPVLSSSRYYRNTRNQGNTVVTTTVEVNKVETNTNSNNATNTKPFSHYYVRKNRYYNSSQTNNNNQENENQNLNQNQNNVKKEEPVQSGGFIRRRFQVSSSTTNVMNSTQNSNNNNISNNNVENKDNTPNNSIYSRRYRQFNINTSNANDANKSEDKDKKDTNQDRPRFRYLRQYVNRQDNQPKEENKPNDRSYVAPQGVINLKNGRNYSYGINRQADNKDTNESNKFKNYKYFKVIKNSFQLNPKKYDTSSASRKYGRNRFRYGDSEEKSGKKGRNEFIEDNVIEVKILSNNSRYNDSLNNKYKRKYGRFSHHDENENENLSFKDEKDLVDYLNKKYDQDKIINLLKIKVKDPEKERIREELDELNNKYNKEIRENKENEKKLKKLEKEIDEKNKEIDNKKKEIDNKEKEIEELKNDK